MYSKDSFYVFCASSSDLDASNTDVNFATPLAKRVFLEGEWEVGVVEILIPGNRDASELYLDPENPIIYPANQQFFQLRKEIEQNDRIYNEEPGINYALLCDLVEPSLAFGGYMQILRQVPAQRTSFFETYKNIHYFRVIQKNFDSIRIKIETQSGNVPDLKGGLSQVGLHFRRVDG